MKSVREKLYGGVSRLTWLLGCALIASGCSDEDLSGVDGSASTSGNGIYFGIVDSASGWGDEADARASMSSEDEHETEVFVLRGATASDTLRVGVTVTDGIVVSDNKCASVQSRGVPVEQATDLLNFGVTAFYYPSESSSQPTAYYMKNEQVTRGNDIYSTSDTYYWPSAGQLSFVAVAPYRETLAVGDDYKVSFSYAPDKDASKHDDLMLSNTREKLNNNTSGTAVGLSFEHLLTAVQFKIGGTPTGTVKSISLSGEMVASGTYTVGSGWTYGDATPDAEYVIGYAEDYSTGLVKDQMLLLPQTIGKDKVTLTVVFDDKDSGKERTLSAHIPAIEWVASKTTTYVINITPEYDLEFVTPQNEIPVLDCHYVWQLLKIRTNGRYTGKWAVTTNKDWATVRILPEKNEEDLDLYYQGYWCIDDRGSQILTGESISTGGLDVLVYLYENTDDTDADTRDVVVTLNAVNEKGEYVPISTRTINQYEPIWNGGKAYERIEEYDAQTSFPWGFNWTNTTVKFTGSRNPIRGVIFNILKLFGYGNNVKMEWNGAGATVDMSSIEALGDKASDENNGLQNTTDLLNFDGIADLNSSIALLEGWGMSLDESSIDAQPTNYAVRMILYKNKFNKKTETTGTNTVNVAVLTSDGVQWYLPAPGEVSVLQSTASNGASSDTPLYSTENGYWSSRAVVNSNTNSYYYISSGTVEASAARSSQKRVRAARIKPSVQ